MAKNRAITIGINKYQFMQPLNYAMRDAELMRDFLCNEAGFEKVFYFSDESPEVNGKSTLPYRANLLRVLRQIFENPFMSAGDNFWFFFSGHGMRHNGRDYLMPSDGDPGDVENTAICINHVNERLRRCGADNIVLILDACRNLGTRTGEGIGNQTAEESRQTGVVSIFSCSPNEYSFEIEELKQGAFTFALLEGLGVKGQRATVERLNDYLNYRVPELNRLHGKPRQTPYTIAEPVTKSHLILLPKYATLSDVATLKNDASHAELEEDLELAEQLWIRVIAASYGQDIQALKALQRIERKRLLKQQFETKPIQLISAVGINYTILQNLLAAGKWQEANGETYIVMIKAANREKEGWLNEEDIRKFPCVDLQTIDQLWVKYSNGHFGFSVQKRIWKNFGGQPEYLDDEALLNFCVFVGWYIKENDWWKSYGELIFAISAPEGHLPSVGRGLRIGDPVGKFAVPLLSRAEACKL
jgi:uncharacterized caspase-like protein